jgi:uncharacterized repeat protein (TIGR03803 family)
MFTGNGPDGYQPVSGLLFDGAGNLYGTTPFGGNMSCPSLYGCGVAFKLAPNSNGSWSETVVYDFCADGNTCADGRYPVAAFVSDSSGNLYSTTQDTVNAQGTVFKLAQQLNGSWNEGVLHTFNGSQGGQPADSLVFGPEGDLYGTASTGGPANGGVVFKMAPLAGGTWTYSVIHNFGGGQSGFNPVAGVVFDQAGNLYGTTSSCGSSKACQGVVYEITH